MKNKLLIFVLTIFLSKNIFADSPEPKRAKKAMVVAADSNAVRAGVEILQKGGNAVDAAVAVGFALAVTYPQAGNIGGGGFMVIRFVDGKTHSIDYREKAPTLANRDMYLDANGKAITEKSRFGHLAAGVPGAVDGLLYAQEKFGRKKINEVLSPAIKLAEKGFPLHHSFAEDLENNIEEFKIFPATLKSFSKNGLPYKEGEILIQKDLANTLKRISQNGRDGFYKGKTADLIVEEMQRGGGLITHEDLANYKAKERETVRSTYRGYEIISMAPPSSGGTALIQILNILEGYDLKSFGWNSAKSVHTIAEAMRRVYADRAEFLGDPDFVKVPSDWLLSKKYSNERRATIQNDKATPSSEIKNGIAPIYESPQTTHYSVVDKDGNCVSVTTTLNGGFGSYVTVDGAGFLLNNEMDDFSAKPGVPNMFGLIGGEANAIVPQKRMLSSMTPTIILKDGKPFLVIGTPGGATIITTVLQVILNIIDYDMNLREAIDAPRIHHQWLPDQIFYEQRALSVDTIEKLKSMGHKLVERKSTSGLAEGIMFDYKNNILLGYSDARGYGAAIGY